MKKLMLIRHGETDYTKEGRYCGLQNIPLNARGIEQVHKLSQALRKAKVDEIYSSDLSRCAKTAGIIFKNRGIHKRRGLREIDFGKLSGKNHVDVKHLYPDLYRRWLTDPKSARMPKGETLIGFAKRVERCFKDITKISKNKIVVLVTHGGPIRVVLLHVLKMGLDKFWELEQDTAALNIISFESRTPRVIKMNDTSHLRA